MRAATGADFAVTNSGGLRANLTCLDGEVTDTLGLPCKDGDGKLHHPRQWGGGHAAVRQHHRGGRRQRRGAQDDPGERVSQIDGGRFIQVSGLRIQYDPSLAAGSRITGAWEFDGNSVGDPINFAAPADTYSVAMNDFMAVGGDGYPNFTGQFTTLNLMLDDVINYFTAISPIAPQIQDRHVGDGFGPLD